MNIFRRSAVQKEADLQKNKAAQSNELDLYSFTKIPIELISFGDALIFDNETIHYVKIGLPMDTSLENSNVLVLLHGYGGCGACFYKLAAKLYKNYHLIIIDLPGFGFSSRKTITPFHSIETCLDYYMTRLSKFIEVMNLNYFYLIGHSMGAYLASHLFKIHHQQILKLILLSPAGINPPAENQSEIMIKKHAGSNPIKRVFLSNILNHIFVKKRTPLDYFPFNFMKKASIHFYFSNPRFNFTQLEKKLMKNLNYYFLTLPQCGEYSVCYLMSFAPKSIFPVIDVFETTQNRHESIVIAYGETDVMDHHLTKEEFEKKEYKIQINTIMKSGHQLIFQNPDDTYEMIKQSIDHRDFYYQSLLIKKKKGLELIEQPLEHKIERRLSMNPKIDLNTVFEIDKQENMKNEEMYDAIEQARMQGTHNLEQHILDESENEEQENLFTQNEFGKKNEFGENELAKDKSFTFAQKVRRSFSLGNIEEIASFSNDLAW